MSEKQETSPLLTLPRELLTKILKMVSTRVLHNMARTCDYMKKFCQVMSPLLMLPPDLLTKIFMMLDLDDLESLEDSCLHLRQFMERTYWDYLAALLPEDEFWDRYSKYMDTAICRRFLRIPYGEIKRLAELLIPE